jgi:hypothetical protein
MMSARSILQSGYLWIRGTGVESKTVQRRWVIVVMTFALPAFTYMGVADFQKGRMIDRENARTAAAVVDVVEYHFFNRYGRQCEVRVLASFQVAPSFRLSEANKSFFVGEKTKEHPGSHYAPVQNCDATPRIAVGDSVPIEYAASNPTVNRIYSATSAVGPNLEPILLAMLWLMFGGFIVADRVDKKFWET